LKGDEIEKKKFKLFPIKQTPIKRIGTKSDEKIN
jgi:hypothetical protein